MILSKNFKSLCCKLVSSPLLSLLFSVSLLPLPPPFLSLFLSFALPIFSPLSLSSYTLIMYLSIYLSIYRCFHLSTYLQTFLSSFFCTFIYFSCLHLPLSSDIPSLYYIAMPHFPPTAFLFPYHGNPIYYIHSAY